MYVTLAPSMPSGFVHIAQQDRLYVRHGMCRPFDFVMRRKAG
jgi:hypothetical protein